MDEPVPLPHYRITDHAKMEMQRRQIDETDVARALHHPGQVVRVRSGHIIYQSKIRLGNPSKDYLLRVVIAIDQEPPAVVTVYRTSKVDKYWRENE
jgi:hypothetical protein